MFFIGDLAALYSEDSIADAGDDWTLQRATLESGKEPVEHSEGEAEKNNDKQDTKILEFRLLRL